MQFKATTAQRRHLFLSSTISLRKAVMQWPSQSRDFKAEWAALGKVLHQEVMVQDAPEVTWKQGFRGATEGITPTSTWPPGILEQHEFQWGTGRRQ